MEGRALRRGVPRAPFCFPEHVQTERPHIVTLFATNHQAIDSDGRANCATKFEVVPNFGNIEEELFQISRDRDFFYWVCEFATRNPEAGSATG